MSCRAKQVRSSSAGEDLLFLHPLFLPHRFLEALLEDRLWKEIIAMTLRLLDACAHLSDAHLDATTKGTFGSVRETLMHLFASEEGYVRDITDRKSVV